MQQSALFLGSDSRMPDNNGGGVKVHHDCLGQIKVLQLLQEDLPLLSFISAGTNIWGRELLDSS